MKNFNEMKAMLQKIQNANATAQDNEVTGFEIINHPVLAEARRDFTLAMKNDVFFFVRRTPWGTYSKMNFEGKPLEFSAEEVNTVVDFISWYDADGTDFIPV